MTTIPFAITAQFILAGVGRGAGGKNAKMNKNNRKINEMMLTSKPHLAKLNFEGNNGSPRTLFRATKNIEIAYVVSIAETPRERICVKATVEPRLISDMIKTNVIVTYTALSGNPHLGEIWDV